jgi:hypothetical protein
MVFFTEVMRLCTFLAGMRQQQPPDEWFAQLGEPL